MGTMIKKLRWWIPTLFLVLVLIVGVGLGAGVEPVAVAGILLVQALVFVVPYGARWVGGQLGARQQQNS